MMGEHALDELSARLRIGQAPFVGDRQVGQPRDQRRGEQTAFAAVSMNDRHALDPAARRVGLEDVSVQIRTRQIVDPPIGEVAHRRGHVASCFGRHQRNLSGIVSNQMHRFARGAESGFDLRTYGDPLDQRAEDVHQPVVAFVPGVVAHRLAEQTGGDAEARAIAHAMILAMAKRTRPSSIGVRFENFSQNITQWTGSTSAFGSALGVIIVWAVLGPLFHFSDTWQLVINTGTTIVTFLMVFLIQRSQNKDALAVHLKLNEIVAAVQGASNRLVDVESFSERELEALHRYYGELAKLARHEANVTESHSVEEARQRHVEKLGTPRKAK